MFDAVLKWFGVITLLTWLLWMVNMTGDILIPEYHRAGAPPEVPLTPIYRVRQ